MCYAIEKTQVVLRLLLTEKRLAAPGDLEISVQSNRTGEVLAYPRSLLFSGNLRF